MTVQEIETSKQTLACLIIDDPLLRPRYGCLDYEKLLEEMKAHGFFTEIAFIPWNYRRSDPRTIRLFADNRDYYAICVHGCNHLGNEFGWGNYQELSGLASAALWRMEEHKRLTGLPYDPVMVFPQGRFSSMAMKALKDQGFFAAVNTTICATDREEPPVSEYQRPFTAVYHDFPIFLRRYPKSKLLFEQDIHFGRPVIIVEHHTAFRSGYQKMTDLIDWINSFGNIKWTSLLRIAEHYLGKSWGETDQPSPPRNCVHMSVKAVFRRSFCEFRDNYVERSSLLGKIYRVVRGGD